MTQEEILEAIADDKTIPYPGSEKTRAELRSQFQASFPSICLSDCIDTVMSILENRVVIDVVYFDEVLHARVGNYEDMGLSMEDIIKLSFGDKALNLFMELI